jgi:hypothetical protein
MIGILYRDLFGRGFGLPRFITDQFRLAQEGKGENAVPIVLHVAGGDVESEKAAEKAAREAGREQNHIVLKALPENTDGLDLDNIGLRIDGAIEMPFGGNKGNGMVATTVWLDMTKDVPVLYVDLRGLPADAVQERDDALALAMIQIVRGLSGDKRIIKDLRKKYVEKGMTKEEAAKLGAKVALAVDYAKKPNEFLGYMLQELDTEVVYPSDIPPVEAKDLPAVYGSLIADARAGRKAASAEDIVRIPREYNSVDAIDKFMEKIAAFNKVNAKIDNSSLLIDYAMFLNEHNRLDDDKVKAFRDLMRKHGIKAYAFYDGTDSEAVAALTARGMSVVVDPVAAPGMDGLLKELNNVTNEETVIVHVRDANIKTTGYDNLRFMKELKVTAEDIDAAIRTLSQTKDDNVVFAVEIAEDVTAVQLLPLALVGSANAKIFKMEQLENVIMETRDIADRPKWLEVLSLFQTDTFGKHRISYERRVAQKLDREHLPQISEKELFAAASPLPAFLRSKQVSDTLLDDLINIMGATSAAGIHLAKFKKEYQRTGPEGKPLMDEALYEYVKGITERVLAREALAAAGNENGLDNGDNEALMGRLLLQRLQRKLAERAEHAMYSAAEEAEARNIRKDISEFLAQPRGEAKLTLEDKIRELKITLKNVKPGSLQEAVVINALIELLMMDTPRIKAGTLQENTKTIDPKAAAAIFAAA